MQELQELRKKLDELDKQLIDVVAARFAVNADVRKIKQAQNLPNVDPKREAEMLEVRRQYASSQGVDPDFIEALFQHILRFVTREG